MIKLHDIVPERRVLPERFYFAIKAYNNYCIRDGKPMERVRIIDKVLQFLDVNDWREWDQGGITHWQNAYDPIRDTLWDDSWVEYA